MTTPLKPAQESSARCYRARAFTLIEVVISSALMALIVSSAYLCLHAGFLSQKMIEPRADIIQNARVALALISADLRGACPLPEDSPFIGMHRMLGEVEADNLDFATHNYTPSGPREGDFCEMSYFVDKDAETGQYVLCRRRNPTLAPDPLSGGRRDEIARGILGVRFEYFDGLDWYDTWGDASGRGKEQTSQRQQDNLSGMPEAVRITILFDANPKARARTDAAEEQTPEPPFVFQTVARVELAEKSNSSASGSGGGSGDTTQTGGNN